MLIMLNVVPAASQDKRTKVRISNAGFTITALPLLAAKDWGAFSANGLDVELIVMSPSLAAAALAQGDIDYVAGVGPASVAATLSGLPSRAIWFSSDRISYWLMARSQFKNSGSLKEENCHLGWGGRHQPCCADDRIGKSGRIPRIMRWSEFPANKIQVLYSLESNFVEER
jgi:hypothetical protein